MSNRHTLLQTVRSILATTSIFELPAATLQKIMLVNSVFVALFLLVFQPFQLYRSTFTDLLVVALMTGITIFVVHSLVMKLARSGLRERELSKTEHVLAEWGVSVVVIFSVAATLFAFRTSTGHVPLSLGNAGRFLVYALVMAPFLVLITRAVIVLRVLTALSGRSQAPEVSADKRECAEQITVADPQGNRIFHCALNNFLFAKAEGNYLNVICENTANLRTVLLRCTIASFKQQVAQFDQIHQCHRSYLVNVNQITEVVKEGQARSLRLIGTDLTVPVSRARTKEILTLLEAARNRS